MRLKSTALWALAALALAAALSVLRDREALPPAQPISYAEFVESLDAGAVANAKIAADRISGVLSDGTRFTATAPDAAPAGPAFDDSPAIWRIFIAWFPILLVVGATVSIAFWIAARIGAREINTRKTGA